jgi:general secretion pathway protein A
MYKDFFELKEMPFSIAPDPRFLYLSENHREALAHLHYGINSEGGFVLLTGEVGTGKTTVCRCLLEQLPENTNIAFIYNPKLTVDELLASICDELGIKYPVGNKSIKVFIDCINAYLLDNFAKGRKTVIILEEAQNLSPDVLEEIRLLTNLETNRQKLLQIIMIGQPELKDMLSKPELRQLSQRITALYHLDALSEKDVGHYIAYRLESAGAKSIIFPDNLIKQIYKLSKGIPRLINLICDRAMLGAYTEGKKVVDRKILMKAAREITGCSNQNSSKVKMPWVFAGIFLVMIFTVSAIAYFYNDYKMKNNSKKITATAPLKNQSQEPEKIETIGVIPESLLEKSKEKAFNAMLREWSIPVNSNYYSNVCDYIYKSGIGCLNGSGNLKKLLKLNKPAVLKMYLENGKTYYLFLKSVQDNTALVTIGDELKRIEIKELTRRFSGEYTVFWRMPPEYRDIIYPNVKTPVIHWVDSKLAIINKRNPLNKKDEIYDGKLVEEVKRFQSSRGIPAVGIIGPRTIIQINNETNSNEPKIIK